MSRRFSGTNYPGTVSCPERMLNFGSFVLRPPIFMYVGLSDARKRRLVVLSKVSVSSSMWSSSPYLDFARSADRVEFNHEPSQAIDHHRDAALPFTAFLNRWVTKTDPETSPTVLKSWAINGRK